MAKEVTKIGEKEEYYHKKVEVKLRNLTKKFVEKNGGITIAVNDFTVNIPAGKLIGLLGPSGCGKSTTLYLISGLHKPDSGAIYFGDEDVTNSPPEKRGIGLVFQNYALYPHMTVRQNIMFPLENVRVPKKEALLRSQKMAELVHIGDLMNRKPNQLSGGQQQRVAIARALVKEPRVLLLDEPLSNLDARLRLQTREEIRRIQKETGVTTIFVTHDQEEAMSISDEIIVMHEGLKQQIGHPQDVYEEPVNQFVARFLGNPPINIIPGFLKGGNVLLEDGTVIDKGIKQSDRGINIGLRPEYLKLSEKGHIKAIVDMVEHIGRDTMLICFLRGTELKIRTIIPSEGRFSPGDAVAFECKKIFVFDGATGERYK